jgi:hypothetical protein
MSPSERPSVVRLGDKVAFRRRRDGVRQLTSTQIEILGCAAALLVSVGVELIVAWFIHRKGVNLTGDEPAYIIQAQAYLHLSPNILSTIRADLSVHSLAAYAPGAPVSAVASFAGPRGVISPFEPGLGLLLIPFVATGRLFLGSTVGMLVLNTAGLIYIHRRVSRLTTLDRRCQFLLGLMLAAPAVLLAVTQIYPDLLSGILLACAIVEIAFIERTGVSARLGTAVIGFSLAFLPWLQGKNLAPAVVALVALLIVRLRVSAGRRTTFVILTLCLLSWGLLLAYNLRYFGHLTGLPEPAPNFGHNGVEYTLGLLFDRDQGLFVQVPVAVVGFLGLWMARKRLPISVIATVVSVGSVLLLNGTLHLKSLRWPIIGWALYVDGDSAPRRMDGPGPSALATSRSTDEVAYRAGGRSVDLPSRPDPRRLAHLLQLLYPDATLGTGIVARLVARIQPIAPPVRPARPLSRVAVRGAGHRPGHRRHPRRCRVAVRPSRPVLQSIGGHGGGIGGSRPGVLGGRPTSGTPDLGVIRRGATGHADRGARAPIHLPRR